MKQPFKQSVRTGKECLYFEGQVVYDATQKHSCMKNYYLIYQASRVGGGFLRFIGAKRLVFFFQPTPPCRLTREALFKGAV